MRLIDADKIREVYAPIAPIMVGDDVHYEPIVYMWEIDNSPTVEAEPVVHAHWFTLDPNKRTGKAYKFACSSCERVVIKSRQVSISELGYRFCPHCGAKMDEGEHIGNSDQLAPQKEEE